MKKVLCVFLLFFCFLFSEEAYAKCNHGTEITGKNGHVYCISNIGMNWWTAFAWCKTQGRHLVSLHEACDTNEEKWDGSYGAGGCKNLNDKSLTSRWCWTSVPFGYSTVYGVRPSTGGISHDYGNDFYAYRTDAVSPALCY